jgi:hypothetical protein
MDIKRINQQVIEETTLGIYVWEMPDGRWIGDDNGNFLSITAKKGNQSKINLLADAVKAHGIYEGQPKFLAGRRKIDDEEFQHQKQRLEWGLTPDPLDIGVYKDSLKKGEMR